MEKISLLLDDSTVEMLHLLARDGGQTIGTVVQEMALERYMNHALNAGQDGDLTIDIQTSGASLAGHDFQRPG